MAQRPQNIKTNGGAGQRTPIENVLYFPGSSLVFDPSNEIHDFSEESKAKLIRILTDEEIDESKITDPSAQWFVGHLFRTGQGVSKNLVAARNWFQKAADQGDAMAQLNLGYMYYTGEGGLRDLKKAAGLFEKLVNRNWRRLPKNRVSKEQLAMTQAFLGNIYSSDNGIPKDDLTAVKWYNKSAKNGCFLGERNLGVVYLLGKGLEEQPSTAASWFQKAADHNDAPSMLLLSSMFSVGLGVPQNSEHASELITRAYELEPDLRESEEFDTLFNFIKSKVYISDEDSDTDGPEQSATQKSAEGQPDTSSSQPTKLRKTGLQRKRAPKGKNKISTTFRFTPDLSHALNAAADKKGVSANVYLAELLETVPDIQEFLHKDLD
ncbi:MAG: tetratricopeptide repeat protein [Alphaproteobacteria bacterium]